MNKYIPYIIIAVLLVLVGYLLHPCNKSDTVVIDQAAILKNDSLKKEIAFSDLKRKALQNSYNSLRKSYIKKEDRIKLLEASKDTSLVIDTIYINPFEENLVICDSIVETHDSIVESFSNSIAVRDSTISFLEFTEGLRITQNDRLTVDLHEAKQIISQDKKQMRLIGGIGAILLGAIVIKK